MFTQFVNFDGDINALELELYINDELKQKGGVELMMNKPFDIIKEFNSFASFEDGDILMTGTPKGVGSFEIGDKFLSKLLYDGKVLIQKEFIVS